MEIPQKHLEKVLSYAHRALNEDDVTSSVCVVTGELQDHWLNVPVVEYGKELTDMTSYWYSVNLNTMQVVKL
jgi:hypothetical protein